MTTELQYDAWVQEQIEKKFMKPGEWIVPFQPTTHENTNEIWQALRVYSYRSGCLAHALSQGAHAGEIQSAKMTDCPYEFRSIWQWAWRTGFDLGRRINSRGRAAKALLDRMNKVKAERTKWLDAVDAGTNDYEADIHNEAVAEGLGIAVEILFGPGA